LWQVSHYNVNGFGYDFIKRTPYPVLLNCYLIFLSRNLQRTITDAETNYNAEVPYRINKFYNWSFDRMATRIFSLYQIFRFQSTRVSTRFVLCSSTQVVQGNYHIMESNSGNYLVVSNLSFLLLQSRPVQLICTPPQVKLFRT